MNFQYHPEAEAELYEAVEFYEAQQSGLAGEFLDEIETSIQSILVNPLQYALVDDESSIRIAKTKRFPYGLVFDADSDVLILAIMHLHRRPGYWAQRRRPS